MLVSPRARLPSPLLPCIVRCRDLTVQSLGTPAAQPQHPTDTPLPGARHKNTPKSSSYWKPGPAPPDNNRHDGLVGICLSSTIHFFLSGLCRPFIIIFLSFESLRFLSSRSHCNTTKMVHQHLRAAGQHIYRRFADEPEKFTLPKWAPAVLLADLVIFLPLLLVVREPPATPAKHR